LGFALTRGFLLGLIGAIPVGPVNAAVIDTALRRSFRRALAIGLGGAFVDLVYCQLAVAGLGTLFARVPHLGPVLLGVGGVVLIAFGLVSMRAPAAEPVGPKPPMARALARAFLSGVLISVMNPAVLLSWVLIASTLLADVSVHAAPFAGLGVFVGTSLWFLIIAYLARRGRVRLGRKAIWVTRIVAALLIGYGAFLVIRSGVALAKI
jgi:L-lysine exporter family protein LysE/ArgO